MPLTPVQGITLIIIITLIFMINGRNSEFHLNWNVCNSEMWEAFVHRCTVRLVHKLTLLKCGQTEIELILGLSFDSSQLPDLVLPKIVVYKM